MTRAPACLGAMIACAIQLGCTDAPTLGGGAAANNACSPLDEPGATVTSEGLTKDGHYVVVVSRAAMTRVFYGVAAHVVEGTVTSVHQSCALEIDFDVSGRSEVATFSPGPPGCAVASTLTSGNAGDAIVQTPLTVVVPAQSGDGGDGGDGGQGASDAGAATSLSALTFFCL